MTSIKGYKAVTWDLHPLYGNEPFQYRQGLMHVMRSRPELCFKGFHFCACVADLYTECSQLCWVRVFEIEAGGAIIGSRRLKKFAAQRMRLVRELSPEDQLDALDRSYARRRLKDSRHVLAHAVGVLMYTACSSRRCAYDVVERLRRWLPASDYLDAMRNAWRRALRAHDSSLVRDAAWYCNRNPGTLRRLRGPDRLDI